MRLGRLTAGNLNNKNNDANGGTNGNSLGKRKTSRHRLSCSSLTSSNG